MTSPNTESDKSIDEIGKILVNYRIMCDVAVSERDDGFYSQDDYEKAIERRLEEAEESLCSLLMDVIGEYEKHDNGHKMVNDPSACMDCSNPDERWCRNVLRAIQRQKLNKLFNKEETSK